MKQSSSPAETDYAESWTAASEYDEPGQVRHCSPNRVVVTTHLAPEPASMVPIPNDPTRMRTSSSQADSPTSIYFSETGSNTPSPMLFDTHEQASAQIHRAPVSAARFNSPMPEIHEARQYASAPFQSSRTDEDHFIRLLRRMEVATPNVMLDRMCEDWQNSSDPVVHEELCLEKQLWALVAVESAVLDPFLQRPSSNQARRALLSLRQHQHIVEIDGNLGMC